MFYQILALGARPDHKGRREFWDLVDHVDDLETANNVARSWLAKGYRVRIECTLADGE